MNPFYGRQSSTLAVAKRQFAALAAFVVAAPALVHAQASGGSGIGVSATPTPSHSGASTEAAPPAANTAASTSATQSSPSASASAAPVSDKSQDAEALAAAAALEAQSNAAGAGGAGDEPKISIYGFSDFTFTNVLNDYAFGPADSTFAVGNLNVYMATDLGDDMRSLVEIRFLYLPHGTTTYTATGSTRQDTAASDYSDVDRPVKWGGISIQRAWVERTFHPLFTIRAGQWLTPYGIWNVDHGSPVIVGVRRPYIVGESLFPQSQSGLEAYGTTSMGANQFGYHLTLSNGRGPIDTYKDLDANKAIGGRVTWRNESNLGTLTLGASAFAGTYTDKTTSLVTDASRHFSASYAISTQYDELSLGGDLKFEAGGLLLQGEVIANEMAYSDEGRPSATIWNPELPAGFTPDSRRWGYYGLVGYRFPFLGIMPFFGTEGYKVGKHSIVPDSRAFWGGLNVRPSARLVLKAQYTQWDFPTKPINGVYMDGFKGLDFQVAWSF